MGKNFRKLPTFWRLILTLLLLGIGFKLVRNRAPAPPTLSDTQSGSVAQSVKSDTPPVPLDEPPAEQLQRPALIDQMVSAGVVVEFDLPSRMYLYITPAFADLPRDDKKSVVSAIYGYYVAELKFEGEVRIFDLQTGKEVSKYDQTLGLRID